jgi:RimJ/RimL family protein N-acetyltransferase
MIRMSRKGPPGTVETGMWLGRPFRGKGIAAAALRALLVRAAEAGAGSVIADTTPDNAAALGTLGSVGAVFTPTPDKIYAAIPVPVSPGVPQTDQSVVG